MNTSRWVIADGSKNKIVRASTIKPRIDYACSTIDEVLEILTQRKFDLNGYNLSLYVLSDGRQESAKTLETSIRCELEISYAIESLRQVRRSLDSIVGLGNVPLVLSPSVSIVRVVRSRMVSLVPSIDYDLGELSLLLSGVIVDSAHLASLNLDFERANGESQRLMDEAKLIADSKLYKQFPNLDFL